LTIFRGQVKAPYLAMHEKQMSAHGKSLEAERGGVQHHLAIRLTTGVSSIDSV
jgi:hypothetical protein